MNKQGDYTRDYRYGKVWREVFKRDKNCKLCGSNKDLCIDHILPVRLGGKSTLENMRVLCRSCNTNESHSFRNVDQKTYKRRMYMREWVKKHPHYFAFRSREFRKNHPGYDKNDRHEQYKQALAN